MLRYLLILLITAACSAVHAQVSIAVQVPQAGVLQKEQLWNLSLVNASENALLVNVELTLLSAADNRPVLKGMGKSIVLGKGALLVRAADVSPVTYNYLSPVFNVDRTPNGFIAIGRYLACYTVTQVKAGEKQSLAEDCVPVEVEPLSPPQLNLPEDKAVVNSAYPSFSWLPPMPLQLFSDLSYDFLLTEVRKGQLPEQAIQQNMPIMVTGLLKQPFYNWVPAAKGLDTSKTYAWQVIAKNFGLYAARSEVWTFRLQQEQPVPDIVKASPYIKAGKEMPEKGIAPDGFLKLVYTNTGTDSLIRLQIRDISGAGSESWSVTLPVQRGDNFLVYDLRKLFKPAANALYEATWSNSDNESWKIRFTVKYFDK